MSYHLNKSQMNPQNPSPSTISRIVAWILACLLGLLRPIAENGKIKALMGLKGFPAEPDKYERYTRWEHIAAYVLIAGLIVELTNGFVWYHGRETLAAIAATLLIVCGVWGEVYFGNKARIEGDKQIAEFRVRAAEAELRLEELRKQVGPRSISKEQFEAIQTLKGRVKAVNLVVEADAECETFAALLAVSFQHAGMIVREYKLPPDMHGSCGLVVYEPRLSEGEETEGKAIWDTLFGAKIFVTGLVDRLPDRAQVPRDVPAILVYGKFPAGGNVIPYLGPVSAPATDTATK